MTKKSVFFSSLGVSMIILYLGNIKISDYCNTNITAWCRDTWDVATLLAFISFVFIPVLFFSLITYKMRNEVFEHWMKFAKWATPTTIIIFFLLSVSPRSHNIMSGAFEAFILFLTLGIFCIVSLWRIAKKYIELKKR